MAISAWVSPGVQMSIRSMSSRSIRRRQSVSTESQPSLSAAARTPSAFRPATAVSCGLQRQVEKPWRGAPGVGVGGAHEGVAHHAHAQGLWVVMCSPFDE